MKTRDLLSFFTLLVYLGCGESMNMESDSELNVTKKDAQKIEQQKDLLKELGFEIEEKKVTIDFNKTANFMKKMEIEMHGKADEIQHKIEKADINFSRDMGINISDDKFEIDLNKTKNMFHQIDILMKEVLLEGNSSKN